MKKLDLYILKEHISPFIGGLATFTLLLLLNRIFQLMDLIIRKGVPVWVVFKIFLYSLPFILSMTVSMALLIASLVAYGRLAQDFELIALRSLGISFKRTFLGPLSLAIGVFLFMVYFNGYILPESNHKVKNLLFDISLKKPAIKIREGMFTKITPYSIYISKKDEKTGRVEDVKILEKLSQAGTVRMIIADSGYIKSFKDTLVLFLYEGFIYETAGQKHEDAKRIDFKRQILRIPINDTLILKERKYRGSREMNFAMLKKAISQKDREIKRAGKDSIRIRILKLMRNRYLVEFHKKISLPFAGIVFIVLGGTISAITKRGGYGAAFGVSFVIFTLYYIFLIGGEELSRRGYISPAFAMWFPNIFFAVLTWFLIKEYER